MAIAFGIVAIIAATAVVTLFVTRDDGGPAMFNQAENHFPDVFKKVQSGIVRIETLACSEGRVGTGFLITPTLVATARHVVQDTTVISIFANGESAAGTTIGYSASDDLALVRLSSPLSGHNFSFAPDPAVVGDPVAAVGFPIGLPITLTVGTVSGLNRSVTVDSATYTGLLQTDAAVNPGNSGGPLINTDGKVVAVVDIAQLGAAGIAYGIPAAIASPRVDMWRADPVPVAPSTCGNPGGSSTGRPQLEPPTSLPESVALGVTRALNTYFDGINTGDYRTAFGVLSERLRSPEKFRGFASGVSSSFDFDLRILDARQIDSETAQVDLSFISLQDPSLGPEGQSCTHWTLEYRMVLETDGRWHIDGSEPYNGQRYEAC